MGGGPRPGSRLHSVSHVPAGLNFSSPMAYAVAKAHDVPLLFKGDDFSRTDVRRPHA
jgi:uncharacterized protein with PIN domain